MKKILNLALLFTLIFALSSCGTSTPEPKEDFLDIYYLNDFHGALLSDSDQIGITYIANYIKTQKIENPDNVLFVVGGDILQGSALSNYYEGLSTITLFNEIGLDAFTIGNHEFDWGIETVLKYADGDQSNGEADYPFLGANIFYKGTTTSPEGIDPYTIVEKGNHKVGIIGTMGYGLEYSIATSKIEDYEFADPMVWIEHYAEYLRTVENCDVVIVVAHDSGNINNEAALLTGDKKIDAVFNGHSHSDFINTNSGIPFVQSGSNGELVGHVKMAFSDNGEITYIAENLQRYDSQLFATEDEEVKSILEAYILETDSIFNTPILNSNSYFSQSELSDWIAELMRVATNADIGFQNGGGTRTSIGDGDVINLGLLYQIWPFDNVVKTVQLTGAQINSLKRSLEYSTNIDEFDADTLYTVATNDYVFDKPTNPFLSGDNPVNTGILLRDLANDEMLLQKELYSTFDVDNEILTSYISYQSTPQNQKEENN